MNHEILDVHLHIL